MRAWLEGSVVTVETADDVRWCDLANAWRIRLRWLPTVMRGWCQVLYGYQAPGGPPARLVLQGGDGILLSADHLRALAQIIGSRPEEPGNKMPGIVRRLNDLAACQDSRTKPVDWSFRAQPAREQERRQPIACTGSGTTEPHDLFIPHAIRGSDHPRYKVGDLAPRRGQAAGLSETAGGA